MWLYYLLHTISTVVSWLPYKLVVIIGKGMGHLYHKIAKKQRIRAEQTIKERLGYDDQKAYATIKRLFINLGITFMEIMYMPALNKDNIRGLVTFDRPEVLWETLDEKAVSTIKTVLMVEYARCNKLPGEEVVKFFEGINFALLLN